MRGCDDGRAGHYQAVAWFDAEGAAPAPRGNGRGAEALVGAEGRRLGGYKFTRQVPLGPYIVDFLCRSRRLVVELDGDQHAWSDTDAARTAFLNRNGYSVLRFWNNELFKEFDEVLTTILAVLGDHVRAPSPGLRFAPADLSPRGEE